MPIPKWKPHSGEETNYWWVIVDQDKEDTEIGSGDGGFEEDQAHLMAAAPYLLESNKNLLDIIHKLVDKTHLSTEEKTSIEASQKLFDDSIKWFE